MKRRYATVRRRRDLRKRAPGWVSPTGTAVPVPGPDLPADPPQRDRGPGRTGRPRASGFRVAAGGQPPRGRPSPGRGGYRPEAFGPIPNAVWWRVAALTTVGYGPATGIQSVAIPDVMRRARDRGTERRG